MASEVRWPVGFRIRPSVDPASAKAEVADTVTGRRFHWSPEALAEHILRGGEVNGALRGDQGQWVEALAAAATDRAGLVAGWRHWQDRGWHPSDQYYVASRRWAYADTVDTDAAIRSRAMETFVGQDGPPLAEETGGGPVVLLGPPAPPDAQPVSQLLLARRSGRAYAAEPVPLERLSGLLWYGLTDVRVRRRRSRADRPMSYLDSYGSAWDFGLCVYRVAGLDPGVYRYDPAAHELTSILPGDHRHEMAAVLQGMRSPATAAWTLGLIADFPRYQWRYRHEHALRRLYLEAGILGQELITLGMSYGLRALVTPAQRDRPYLALHKLSEDRFAPVYTITMGKSRGNAGIAFGG